MDLTEILIYVAGIVGVLYLSLVAMVTFLAVGMGKMTLRRVTSQRENLSYRQAASAGATDEWMMAHQYERAGVFETGVGPVSSIIVAWRHTQASRFICMYLIQEKTTFDLVTLFEPADAGLTTSSSKDGKMFPRDDVSWMQQFPDATLDELYRHHEAAEQALMSHHHYRLIDSSLEFEDSITKSVQDSIAFARTFMLWPLRTPVWYLLRRWRGKRSVVDQLEKGATGPWR